MSDTENKGVLELESPPEEYKLDLERSNSVWVSVGPFSVKLKREGDGVAVDVGALGDEMANAPMATCWAHDSDLPKSDDEGGS